MLPSPTGISFRRGRRSCLHTLERMCCSIFTFFPLVFVGSLTTWAVWTEVQIGMLPQKRFGTVYILAGITLYVLLNWSYYTAVFTDPGSPMVAVPHTEDVHLSSITVNSRGELRYCKKCQCLKPDRTHHCSSCRRCVLKMDHHCPWLATCVGLHNYKAFILFLTYTSLFSWLCFLVSATWLWSEIVEDTRTGEVMMPVHFVVLSVVSGIIGLVITGFTGYHIYLTTRNRTTIESLEKTRYLSPLRSMGSRQLNHNQTYEDPEHHSFGEQLRDIGHEIAKIHVNALPGITRPEEGEETGSAAQNSLRQTLGWEEQSRRREYDQYNDYLDERDNEKLPNAFDLGWKRNLHAVMGPNVWLWPFPIMNSIGDGWRWEKNHRWEHQHAQLRQERERELERQAQTERAAGWGARDPRIPDVEHGLSKADQVLGRTPNQFYDGPAAPRRRPPPDLDLDDDSSDEEQTDGKATLLRKLPKGISGNAHPGTRVMDSWNDVPDDMLGEPASGRKQHTK
ncbi:zf-DHHC-domain-containing protein [Microthyrium microscopicum]|uniref:Palmitoyltransferase n=1 Tax=Microthyrium microscopicum TaxID=703497 RepID=A0A6A6UE09_9PEZI|nr:zf-DHHC-domain-containing protein [Microthyrium microscopicum]